MFSFHEQKMYELKQKDRMEETKEARIEEIADDLYQTRLSELTDGEGWVLWGVLNSIDVDNLPPLGALIRDNKPLEAGELLIKLVTNQLREDARNEADESK
jgi:hypothetical protein